MAKFEISHEFVDIQEGGYTDDPDDDGNWTGGKKNVGILAGTNSGISAPTYSNYLKRACTKKEMMELSEETVKKLYKIYYWKPIIGDDIKNQSVATLIYDTLVQFWDEAFEWTRQGLRNQNIKIKGQSIVVIGRPYFNLDIINAVNNCDNEWLFNDIKILRKKRYQETGGKYLKGWLKRLDSIEFDEETI